MSLIAKNLAEFQREVAVVCVFFQPKTYGIYIPQDAATTSLASCGKKHPKSHKKNQTGNINAIVIDEIPQKPQLLLPLG